MKKTLILTATLTLLAACDMSPLVTGMQETVDTNAREAAKAAVIPIILSTNLPNGQPMPQQIAVPMAECAIDNATGQELARLAGAAVTQATADTALLVADILKRPGTQTCVTQALTQS